MLSFFKRDNRLIIFLHVPKTAGSTLRAIVEAQYKKDEIYTTIKALIPELREEFAQLDPAVKKKLRVVRGHLEFGVHEFFPDRKTSYFSFLRDPVERIISHYHFVKRQPAHYLYKQVMDNNMNIEEYVSSGISSELNDGQTRLIAGQSGLGLPGTPDFGQTGKDMLAKAIANIEAHFDVVGIQEDFDRSVKLLGRTYNWNIKDYKTLNVSPEKHKAAELSPQTRAVIEKYNMLDMELYEYCKRRFEAQLKTHNLTGK